MKKNEFRNTKNLAVCLIAFSMLLVSSTLSIALPAADNTTKYYTLRTAVDPVDGGIIELDPPFVTEKGYVAGTIVRAMAIPNTNDAAFSSVALPSYIFDHWSGDVRGTDPSIEILMDSDKYICANFIINNDDNTGDSGLSNIGSPIADFTFRPLDPLVNEIVYFDASSSYDTDGGRIVDFSWSYTNVNANNFPETMGTGKTIEYHWGLPGVYNVILTVTDDKGNSASKQQEIVVKNEKTDTPILAYDPASFYFDEFEAGKVIDGSFKVFNIGGGILNFEIILPEGIIDDAKENAGPIQIYPLSGTSTGPNDVVYVNFMIDTTEFEAGTYEGCIDIISNGGDGEICGTLTILEYFYGEKPVAKFAFNPSSAPIGATIVFDASESYDPDGGDIVNYTWIYTTDPIPEPSVSPIKPYTTMGYGITLEYSWNLPANYHVLLIVVDDEGNSARIIKDVLITSGNSGDYYTLNVVINPLGSGSVSLNPSGGVYEPGTEVTVTAIPNGDYYFDQWRGDVSSSSNSIKIVMNSNKYITAYFCDDGDYYTLNVVINPLGSGSVSLNPSGGIYEPGTEVTVTAIPNGGYYFDHWSGDADGTGSSIDVTMSSNKYIEAVFKTSDGSNFDISIVSPEHDYLYIRGYGIDWKINDSLAPVIIGSLTVEVTIDNAIGDVSLKLYVDDELKVSNTTSENTASLIWDERAFLRHTIKIVATDEADSYSEDSIEVIIFNLG